MLRVKSGAGVVGMGVSGGGAAGAPGGAAGSAGWHGHLGAGRMREREGG
jgi:hypothetical protein